jgi:hypothetical protein
MGRKMTEFADYKLTTPEYTARAIAVLVNPMNVRGSVRLVCASNQPPQAIEKLELAFLKSHAVLGIRQDPAEWAKACMAKLFDRTFVNDMLCTSTPDNTPVVLIKETAIEKMTVEQALIKAHAHSVLRAIEEGLDVPENVLNYMIEQENAAHLQRP